MKSKCFVSHQAPQIEYHSHLVYSSIKENRVYLFKGGNAYFSTGKDRWLGI